MEATQTQAVTVFTAAIAAEAVARHMRPGIAVRKATISPSGCTARVFLTGIVGNGAPKSAYLVLDGNGYRFIYGNTSQGASFGDALWSAWFAAQGNA